MMSGIRFELQKLVFEGSKERLHGVLPVNKAKGGTGGGRKKKASSKGPGRFLCVTGTIERPTRFTLYLVKKTDKGFKRKQEWTLSSLKEADYKNKDSLEFDIQHEKLYQWTTLTLEEKDVFFSLLQQICSRLHRPPKLKNFHSENKETPDENGLHSIIPPRQKDDQLPVESDEDEFGLTEREENDLEKVFSRAESSVVNAEAFMDQLAKELSVLDGENIHRIMESEAQVNALMDSIDQSVKALETIESELLGYEEAVTHVRLSVQKIEEENSQMGTASKNNQLLLKELTDLIKALDFPHSAVLINPDFKSREGVRKVVKAAYDLKEALNIEDKIQPALLRMDAVVEQKARLNKLKKKFSSHLASYLLKLFVHLANSYSSVDIQASIQGFRLPALTRTHDELLYYSELTAWQKTMDPDAFNSLLKTYTSAVQRIHEKHVKLLFEEARVRISGSGAATKLSGSSSDLRVRGRYFGKTRSLATREGDTESQGSGEGSVDSSERQHFYDVLEQVLEGLEPAVNSEENFIVNFFHIENTVTSPSTTVVSPSTPSRSSIGEFRRLMTSIFGPVESELTGFLSHYEKMEGSFCMGAMVRLGRHALRPENTSSFIGLIFGSVLIQEKRAFDRLMNSFVQAINDSRLPRKVKPGILAFVTDFEDFAVMAETIFDNSARKSDLEKWYVRMLTTVFDGIGRLSLEGGSRTPGEVIRMENFHRLHAILSQLKVPALDQQRRDSKARYSEALNAYVTMYFGRPLVKLNEFFEGVQVKVSQGVKESEIGYQMAFSRTELKRVIKEYPAKEVKKGLEALYKKVEKHLSEEENLLQVVWRAMQEEFIVQYKSIESLIGRCYPGAKITLEFTIDDILLFFSEIAQQH